MDIIKRIGKEKETSQKTKAVFLQSTVTSFSAALSKATQLANLAPRAYASCELVFDEHHVMLLHLPVFRPGSSLAQGTPLVHMRFCFASCIFWKILFIKLNFQTIPGVCFKFYWLKIVGPIDVFRLHSTVHGKKLHFSQGAKFHGVYEGELHNKNI